MQMFFIGGFLTRKHLFDTEAQQVLLTEFLDELRQGRRTEAEEVLLTEFPNELRQGGLSIMSTLLLVNFVYCAIFPLHALLDRERIVGDTSIP